MHVWVKKAQEDSSAPLAANAPWDPMVTQRTPNWFGSQNLRRYVYP